MRPDRLGRRKPARLHKQRVQAGGDPVSEGLRSLRLGFEAIRLSGPRRRVVAAQRRRAASFHRRRAKLKALYDDRSGLHCLDVARAFEDSAGDVWVACMYPAVSFVRWSRQSDEFHTFGPAENWDTSGIVTLIREPHPGEFGRSQRKVFRVFITAVSNRSQGPETCHSPVIPGRTWE